MEKKYEILKAISQMTQEQFTWFCEHVQFALSAEPSQRPHLIEALRNQSELS